MKNLSFLLFCLFGSLFCKAQLYGLDSTFATNGIYQGDTGGMYDMVIQPDKKAVVVGVDIVNGVYKAVVKRFNENGTIDIGFANNGVFMANSLNMLNIQLRTLCLQPDGKILVGGNGDTGTSKDDCLIIRLSSDGKVDSSFGGAGYVMTAYHHPWSSAIPEAIYSIALKPDGQIVAYGMFHYIRDTLILIRYQPDGKIDSSFGIYGRSKLYNGFSYPIPNDVGILPSGNIILGVEADIDALSGARAFTAIRLLPNGSLDTSFNHTGIAYTNNNLGGLLYCKSMSLQPDGKVLLAGYADSLAVVRFDTSGQLDNSFGTNGLVKLDPAGKVTDMLLQPDGKIVVATNPDGFPYPDTCYTIYRLMPNGTIDYGFGISGKILTKTANASNLIGDIALQSDGKLLASGAFMQGGLFPAKVMLVRYTPNATSVKESDITSNILIYPNPANYRLNIDNLTSKSILNTTLYSLEGKLLHTSPGTIDHLDTESLPNGIYVLRLQFADHPTLTRKLIIQHH